EEDGGKERRDYQPSLALLCRHQCTPCVIGVRPCDRGRKMHPILWAAPAGKRNPEHQSAPRASMPRSASCEGNRGLTAAPGIRYTLARSGNPMTQQVKHALAGVRVLEIAQFFAGPMVGRMMVDLGAEVIKLERAPLGDLIRQGQGIPVSSGGTGANRVFA